MKGGLRVLSGVGKTEVHLLLAVQRAVVDKLQLGMLGVGDVDVHLLVGKTQVFRRSAGGNRVVVPRAVLLRDIGAPRVENRVGVPRLRVGLRFDSQAVLSGTAGAHNAKVADLVGGAAERHAVIGDRLVVLVGAAPELPLLRRERLAVVILGDQD